MNSGIKHLKAAVRRLEDALGKGQRNCAYCRFRVRRLWPDPKRAVPNDLFMAKCEFCHSDYPASLKWEREGDREMLRLVLSFTLEDQYTNPKAHAVQLWMDSRNAPNAKTRELTRTLHNRAKKEVGVRTFIKLRDEIIGLYERKHQELRARYGDDPFPEHRRIIESLRSRARRAPSVYVEGLHELEKEETECLMRAEMEKIVWGQASAETASAVERIGREIDELIKTTVLEKGGHR
jgi:hypothetical protein